MASEVAVAVRMPRPSASGVTVAPSLPVKPLAPPPNSNSAAVEAGETGRPSAP